MIRNLAYYVMDNHCYLMLQQSSHESVQLSCKMSKIQEPSPIPLQIWEHEGKIIKFPLKKMN